MTNAHFIVGHDDSAHAGNALSTAIELGRPAEAELTIVFVRHHWVALAISTVATTEHNNALDSVAASIGAHLEVRLRDYPGRWSVEQRHGDPADELINAATQHQATAIIVGHRGHSTLTDLLIGSVANHLVHHSPITVIVTR
jgi:nucleotide-binding universal stress UspA family protein